MTDVLSLPDWWPQLLERLLGADPADAATADRALPVLRRMSEYLNDAAARSGKTRPYLRQRSAREAYLLYYATANMLKLVPPLRELSRSGFFRAAPASPLRVLDLGCGPGTGVAGLHAFLGTLPVPPEVDLLALDAVPANAVLAARVGETARTLTAVPLRVRGGTANLAHPPDMEERFDLILMMNLLNELPETGRERLRSWLAAHLAQNGHLLIVEPALRDTGRALLRFRDAAAADGWTVYAPCFRQAACPALADAGDWCHHDADWERPGFIARLDEGMGNIKKSLKFSYLLLNRHGDTLAQHLDLPRPQRVVSELFVEKGRTWCFLCGEEGRRRCQRNRRDRSDTNAAFDDLRRYDVLTLLDEELRAHDVRIPSAGTVRLGRQ